jgi:peroxiredoxin
MLASPRCGMRYLTYMPETLVLALRLAEAAAAAPDWQPLYDSFVEGLRTLGIGNTAPRVGDEFPDFALPDAQGHYRTLSDLLESGPIVLSFNRGEWCRYCRTELDAWHCALPQLDVAHGRFVAVTGEIGGRAKALGTILGIGADVLCDVDHAVAMTTGLAFYIGRPMLDRYRAIGLDLAILYGSESGFVPVPATFVIDTDRTVAFAFVDVDFRLRAEPGDVVAAVAALGR